MKKLNIILLISWVIFPPAILLLFHGTFFISIILYLILPSIYFSARKPNIIPKALTVAIAIILPMIVLDYVAFYNNAWAVPTIFPIRFFQFISLEDFLFTCCSVYVIVAGFNYFFADLNLFQINKKKIAKSGALVIVFFCIFLLFYIFRPEILVIRYYYVWLTIIFVVPSILLFTNHREYREPLFRSVIYSLCIMLPYEIVANILGFWSFPGKEYLGMIHLLGQNFPIEEFLIWMILFVPATLGFSKFMAD